MSTAKRVIWLVTLVFFVGGCSSYSVVYPPVGADDPAPVGGWENTVKSGDNVRVTLSDDSQIKGKATNLSAGSLVVEAGRPREKESIVIPHEEIQVVELREGSWWKTTIFVVGSVGGFIALGVISMGAPEFGG